MVKIPLKVFPNAMRYIHDYHVANVVPDRLAPSLGRAKVVWSAPMEGWYKVNFDGVVFVNLKVRVGVVIRNKRGKCLGAMRGLLEYGSDAVKAEALVALRAIEFAANVCPFNMIFEGDCLQVIKAFKSTDFDASKLGHLYIIARSKFHLFRDYSVFHVFREGNASAHCLAQFARNIVGNQVWLESVPPFCYDPNKVKGK